MPLYAIETHQQIPFCQVLEASEISYSDLPSLFLLKEKKQLITANSLLTDTSLKSGHLSKVDTSLKWTPR